MRISSEYPELDDMKEANLIVNVRAAQACNQNKAYNPEQNWKPKIVQWLL